MKSRRIKRALLGLGVAAGLFTAFMFLVHLPSVQVAMGWTKPDGTGACPFGHGNPMVAARPPGPTQTALGFELGAMTSRDVAAWARQHGIRCTTRRAAIECPGVPAGAFSQGLDSGTGTLWFELEASDTVIGIKSSRRSQHHARVAETFTAIERSLTSERGQPYAASGATDGLSSGLFHQATREFRADGYRALIRATNMGDGYLLTERYTL